MLRLALLVALALSAAPVAAFSSPRALRPALRRGGTAPRVLADPTILGAPLALAEEGIKYGSVQAPSWVLPVGALFTIITAAVPILLRPGEEALDKMREQEEDLDFKFRK
uniref:Photosystem I reaction center subunit VIII n=1 Tax=Rhizochromulina marina TaxID=1034831 RepID=A0A7S2SMI4_9STRA|mmetsp:Transcript_32571/g.94326  ORF Transcript_32571/g.94326 Transcript_32571/m.94326 type:complete len:110 (+) Transcript_32571:84-413(+)